MASQKLPLPVIRVGEGHRQCQAKRQGHGHGQQLGVHVVMIWLVVMMAGLFAPEPCCTKMGRAVASAADEHNAGQDQLPAQGQGRQHHFPSVVLIAAVGPPFCVTSWYKGSRQGERTQEGKEAGVQRGRKVGAHEQESSARPGGLA